MNAKYREDLDWMAFRYVAAELSPAENREFERRLEHDQEAREAVGRIVEVTCAVRALDEVERPRVAPAWHLRPWFQRHGLQLAAGLSLALAVVFVVWSLPTSDESKLGNGSLAGVLSPDELAVVWSKARVELSVRHEGDAGGWRWLGPPENEPDAAVPSWDEAKPVDTPDWMMSAVAAMESSNEDQEEPAANPEGI